MPGGPLCRTCGRSAGGTRRWPGFAFPAAALASKRATFCEGAASRPQDGYVAGSGLWARKVPRRRPISARGQGSTGRRARFLGVVRRQVWRICAAAKGIFCDACRAMANAGRDLPAVPRLQTGTFAITHASHWLDLMAQAALDGFGHRWYFGDKMQHRGQAVTIGG